MIELHSLSVETIELQAAKLEMFPMHPDGSNVGKLPNDDNVVSGISTAEASLPAAKKTALRQDSRRRIEGLPITLRKLIPAYSRFSIAYLFKHPNVSDHTW